jgi:hypothetical protein
MLARLLERDTFGRSELVFSKKIPPIRDVISVYVMELLRRPRRTFHPKPPLFENQMGLGFISIAVGFLQLIL